MGNNISSSGPALWISLLLLPSGFFKTIAPTQHILHNLWPKFPLWFWSFCGWWEMTTGMLWLNHATGVSFKDSPPTNKLVPLEEDIMLTMTYIFLGGVYYSLLQNPPSTFRRNRWTKLASLVPVTGTLGLTLAIHYDDVLHHLLPGNFSVTNVSSLLFELVSMPLPWLASGYQTGRFLAHDTPKFQRKETIADG